LSRGVLGGSSPSESFERAFASQSIACPTAGRTDCANALSRVSCTWRPKAHSAWPNPSYWSGREMNSPSSCCHVRKKRRSCADRSDRPTASNIDVIAAASRSQNA
jgi:hypothetical protein